MKLWNVTSPFENAGKYRYWLGIIDLLIFFSANKLQAQGGCSSLMPSFINYEPCKFRVQIVNTSECTPSITVLIDPGEFESWSANAADGWTGQQLAPNMVQLTHSGPFVPLGTSFPMIFTLPVDLVTNGNFNWEFTCGLGESCALIQGIELVSCPDPNDASIIGVKYRECSNLPYSNQTPLSGWTIQAFDADGNLAGEGVTEADGSYGIYDLPKGQYIVREVLQPGWTPNVPPTGEYAVNLGVSEQVVRNFGNCPSCSCDSVYVEVDQVAGSSDTATYFLSIANASPYCFNFLDIQVNSGTLSSWDTLISGWSVQSIGPNQIRLKGSGDYLPEGSLIPLQFQVAGSGSYSITTTVPLANGMNCSWSGNFISPPPSVVTNCCPSGTISGPELITNGDFSNGAPAAGYVTGYNFYPSGNFTLGPGSYTVTDAAGVAAANGANWLCIGKSGNLTDKFMLVDGSQIQNRIVWRAFINNIEPNTNYVFCLYAKNVARYSNNPAPQIQLWANGNVSLVASATLQPGTGWQLVSGTWFSGQNPPGLLDIMILESSINPVFAGRDFALDCISFKSCKPEPCQANIQFTQNTDCSVTVCAVTTGAQPVSYQWCDGRTDACFTTAQTPCLPASYCVTATCADGTTSTAASTFTVTDVTPPVAICNPGVGVDLDANCNYVVSPSFVDGGSTDNCQIQSRSVSPGTLTGCGDHIVTLTVTDFCGNTSSCTMGIQTIEVVPPTIICPSNLTVQGYLDPLGLCKNEVTGIAPQASDNCGLLGVAYTINNGSPNFLPDASGTTFNQGVTTVTYFAADLCQNTASCSFTVTVECTDCQCPAPENPGAELVSNGDFSTTGGFNSDYINNCSGQLEGQLCVSSNPQSVNPGYEPCTDVPTGTGGMLVVNGATTPGKKVWCQAFNVKPNTHYIFRFNHTSLTNASPAQLQVSVNGTAVGSIAQAPVIACAWRQQCLVWNSGSLNGSVQFCIENLNTTAQGNDFALDQISFKQCSRCAPLPSGAVLWMPMDEQGGEASISGIVNGLNGIPSNMVAFGGPDPVAGKVDAQGSGMGALEFNGPNPGSFASVSNDPSLNFGSGPFTIDAWVKTDMTTQTAPIVNKMSSQGGYALAITGTSANANLTMLLQTTNGVQVITGPPINVGQWNFVAAVVDPPNVRLYVGEDPGVTGSFSSTSQAVAVTNATNNNPLRIGYNPQNPHWDISIDELEIFNAALTQTEVKSIWEADADGKCRSLCQCGGFSKLYVRNKNGSVNQPVNCGAPAVNLPCVTGQGYHLVGVFHCDGGECAPDHTINWTLTGPGGTTQTGSFSDNDPFFSIHLLPNWFSQAGNYKLIMSGDCGTQTCSCEVNLTVNCPNLCPCDAVDQQTFQQNVAKGFAAAISQKYCKACFTPLAVSDCETVNWYLNSTGGPYLGTTYGKKTLCHSFAQAGTYTIVMTVDRIKPDGTSCDYAEYTRTITLSCGDPVDCTGPVLPNARFSEDPVSGRLDSIGSSPGWISGGSHEVYLLEDGTSQDGWAMGMTGHFSESGILTSEAPYCVKQSDQGMLSVTLRTMGDPIPGAMIKVGRKPPGGTKSIFLYTGPTIPVPNNPGGFCYPLAVMDDLLPFDDNDWYELEIPYNLSDWAALDSCGDQAGGIPARMALFVTNLLDENQASAGPVHDGVVIDHICFRGVQVGTKDVPGNNLIRIFPNPNTGAFTVTLPAPARPGMRLRITDLAGRMLQELETAPGTEQQTVQAGVLPDGLYFLQVLENDKIIAVEKFVKQ